MAILAIDIGGTKVSLAICEPNEASIKLVRWERFLANDFQNLEHVIETFLDKDSHSINAISMGIAGPLGKLTNLNWEVNLQEISKRFACPNVYALNDLEAHAYGVLQIPKSGLLVLREGKPRAGSNKALIAAGTGLGESILFWDGKKYVPSASEGGHSSFSPTSQIEIELLQFALKRYEHVSQERLVSGTFGFELIYSFFKEKAGANAVIPDELTDPNLHANDYGPLVQKAAESGNKICEKTMELFVHLFGSEAGNLALKGLALSGVYLSGGIPPKLFSWFERGRFLEGFAAKGRFREILENIPIYVIIDDCNALRGAAYYALRKLEGQ